ncbi:MAG TPA: hypothetical protein VKZ79_11390, partial [Alphaproteobacteria bacterium]|nr:hypothetical protein [Alphaproteobacteria bacterium]
MTHPEFRVKLSAHSGDALILPITPEMIALQLEAVDKLTGGKNVAIGAPAAGATPRAASPSPSQSALGIQGVQTPAVMSNLLQLPVGRGFFLAKITPASPAAKAGLEPGEVLLVPRSKYLSRDYGIRGTRASASLKRGRQGPSDASVPAHPRHSRVQGSESGLTRFYAEDFCEVFVVPSGEFSSEFDAFFIVGLAGEIDGEVS